MSSDEGFLRRWARLKKRANAEALAPPPRHAAPEPAPAPAAATRLPELDTLNFDSDFTAFLQDHVEESLRRAALKKLFQSEAFNRMDGLDVYIDDYGKFEPLAAEQLKQLAHAKELLFQGESGEPTGSGQPEGGGEVAAATIPAEPKGAGRVTGDSGATGQDEAEGPGPAV